MKKNRSLQTVRRVRDASVVQRVKSFFHKLLNAPEKRINVSKRGTFLKTERLYIMLIKRAIDKKDVDLIQKMIFRYFNALGDVGQILFIICITMVAIFLIILIMLSLFLSQA